MRARTLTIWLALVALVATQPAPAAATTLRTVGGAALPSGSAFSAALKSSTVFHWEGGSAGDLDCSSSTFGGTVGTNPNLVGVAASVTSFTLSNCTDTVPFSTVSSVTTNAGAASPRPATALYVGSSSRLTIDGLTITLTYSSGSSCTYEPTGGTMTARHDSSTSPWNNEYAFEGVPFSKTAGDFLFCPSTGTWTMTYVASSSGSGMTIQP